MTIPAYQAVNGAAADVRAFLYDAAEALTEWGDNESATALRTAAELLGSRQVVRRIRLEALVQDAHDVEHQAARWCTTHGHGPCVGPPC